LTSAPCQAFNVLRRNGVNVQMISQGASKVCPYQKMKQVYMHMTKGITMLTACIQVNISLVVNDSDAKQCVQALHSAFFENGFLSEVEGADVSQEGSLNSNGAVYGN
jgi:aspartate kinase